MARVAWKRWSSLPAALLLAALPCVAAAAQLTHAVSGIVVNLGIVPAREALRDGGHREAHPPNPPSGSQHLLITLDAEKTHERIGTAEVVLEVTDPRGRVERKPLLHTQGGGLPDYSELFVFGWSGTYTIRVTITPQRGGAPIETRFTVEHKV